MKSISLTAVPATDRHATAADALGEIVGAVALDVAAVTAAVSVGPVAALALPTAALSAVPLATSDVGALGLLASFAPAGGLHAIADSSAAAAIAASLGAAGAEAAAQAAATGTQTGGRLHMNDIAFTKTLDSSTNKF
jgi:hypothetical protein